MRKSPARMEMGNVEENGGNPLKTLGLKKRGKTEKQRKENLVEKEKQDVSRLDVSEEE